MRSRQDAEDAVQQAALRGLERLGTFDACRRDARATNEGWQDARPPDTCVRSAGRAFKGWWFAILRNCCIDVLRRRATGPATIDGHDVAAARGERPDRWEALAEGLERVSAEHREILRLRYFGGLSYRELAEALGIPEGTVMSRLHFARKALAEQLAEEDL